MHRNQFQGVILAAGRGSRIQTLNQTTPKSLLPICNRPLIAYQLEMLQDLNVAEVFIVCGHLKDALQQESEKQNSTGLTLTFVEQRHPLGIAHALGCVEPYINKPFVVFLGDIFVVAPQISQLVQKYGAHMPCSLLAVRDEDDEHLIAQNYNVLLQENGQVHQVIEKPKRAASKCKGCGLYVFDPAIFEAIRRTPQTAMRNEFELTTSIQIHINDGFPVYPFERIDWDRNINSIEDFHLCNMAELQRRGKNAVYGHKCRIHPKASIGNTVLGNEVVIASPICIQHSVILSNTEISTDHDLKHVIGTPDRIIPVQNSNLPQTLN